SRSVAEAARRQHFSTQTPGGMRSGGDYASAGPDPRRNCCSAPKVFQRHEITFKKTCKLPSESEQMWLARADVGFENKACLTRPDWPNGAGHGCVNALSSSHAAIIDDDLAPSRG